MFSLGNKTSIVKLGDDNFLLLKFQIIIALEGYGLDKYLQSESTSPSKFIFVVNETENTGVASSSSTQNLIPNLVYKKWKRQDRLISSWLLGSMSEEILNQMLNCESIKDIWATI